MKFRLQSHDDDVMLVFACPDAGDKKVGELFWNGNEWLFIRCRPNGEQVMDGLHYIPTDPEGEQEHREEDALIAQQEPEAIRAALRQELNGRRKIRRDETRDMAIIGAKIEARKWWFEKDGYRSLLGW